MHYVKTLKKIKLWEKSVYKAVHVAPHPLLLLTCRHLYKIIDNFVLIKYKKL